jgi:hypothetical protein
MHHGLRSVALVATIAGLAAPPRTRTSERYVREWLNAQSAGGFVAGEAPIPSN